LRRRWILLPVLGVAGYFAVFGGEYSLFDLRRLHEERAAQERAVQRTRAEVRVLRARVDSLEHDSLTIERLAREKYGFIRDGERLYRFAGKASPDTGATAH
jgi:cell division protein FtsB